MSISQPSDGPRVIALTDAQHAVLWFNQLLAAQEKVNGLVHQLDAIRWHTDRLASFGDPLTCLWQPQIDHGTGELTPESRSLTQLASLELALGLEYLRELDADLGDAPRGRAD